MKINKKPWPLSTAYKLRDRIDTNPDYQRPAVWTKAQKQLLIESILREYDIPKLYWREVSVKPDKYEVVDGQQRLRAIWEFMDGGYALPKDLEPIDGHDIAGKTYSELDSDMMILFDQYCLDVAVLTDTEEEEVREMFLRLQNGTTLKAQEKRNARPGKMRDFVCELAKHPFFTVVNFDNTRFTYDHIAAQMCCILLSKEICNIKDRDLNLMYENNKDFDAHSSDAKRVQRILNYLHAVFPNKTPELKRYNVISLFLMIKTLIADYALSGREEDICKWFIDFEGRRAADKKKDAENQNPKLIAYHEKTAHSTDAFDSLEFRNKFLIEDLFAHLPDVAQKDERRDFDESQRIVIYRRDGGKCQICGLECDWNNWHADHKVAWSKGGKTSVENGQVLCPACNLSKSDQ